MAQGELPPPLADAQHSRSLGYTCGKKRRRDKMAPITGILTDATSPIADGSAASASSQDAPAGALLRSPTQLGSDQPAKKRRKHADQKPVTSDGVGPESQAGPETEQQPASPDKGAHRKHRKKLRAEAARLATSTGAHNGTTDQHLAATSVSEASDIKHGSRPPSSRKHATESAGTSSQHNDDSLNKVARDRVSAAADRPASSAETPASEQLGVPSGAEASRTDAGQLPDAGQLLGSGAGQSSDAAAQLHDPAEGQEDTADDPQQPTAKRKPGRPKGPGQKVVPPFAPPVRKKPGRVKGMKNKPKAEVELHHKAGKALKITQLKRSKAKSSLPHPTFRDVWKTPPASRKIPPGVDCVWTAQVMLPEKKGKVILGRSYWTAEAAARAVDRAQIAVNGRDKAALNFPLEWYGPEEEQRHGPDLDRWLTRLSGWEGNNPLNAPGVPHIPWVHARTKIKLQTEWEQKKKRTRFC